jgi:ABC-type Mn2+/Zn2+ transport system permease subunit
VPSPLDLVQLPFMRTALEELALLALAGGLLGGFVVLRRLAFFAHASGTATFPGLVVADAAHIAAKPVALAVALGYAVGVGRAGRAGRDPGDAATALLLVAALAAGVVLASDVFHSGASVDRLLFGTLLGLTPGDLAFSGAAAGLALAATVGMGRAWAAVAFDPAGARNTLGPTAALELALLACVAGSVVAAIPAVGALLVTSLFVVPAATVALGARSVPELLAGAVVLAVLEGAIGLYIALWLDVPPGPAVATLGTAVYAVAAAVPRLRGGLR